MVDCMVYEADDIQSCALEVINDLLAGNITAPTYDDDAYDNIFDYIADVSLEVETVCDCEEEYLDSISDDCISAVLHTKHR